MAKTGKSMKKAIQMDPNFDGVSTDRIRMQNPNTGKGGRTIARGMYEPVRKAILQALSEEGEISFKELRDAVLKYTPPEMWKNASVGWYTTSVKLDIEARGLISRYGSPQVLTLTAAGKKASEG